jgi:hypothetical protein
MKVRVRDTTSADISGSSHHSSAASAASVGGRQGGAARRRPQIFPFARAGCTGSPASSRPHVWPYLYERRPAWNSSPGRAGPSRPALRAPWPATPRSSRFARRPEGPRLQARAATLLVISAVRAVRKHNEGEFEAAVRPVGGEEPAAPYDIFAVAAELAEVALACWLLMRHGLLTRKEDPIERLFVRHSVADYKPWRRVYDDFDQELRGMGVSTVTPRASRGRRAAGSPPRRCSTAARESRSPRSSGQSGGCRR